MGLIVALEDEKGKCIEEVFDPDDFLHRLLPSHDDESYQCLRFIDRYGDTVFNRIHMETFLDEWARISKKAQSQAEKDFVAQIEALALRCESDVHLYLKFYGD